MLETHWSYTITPATIAASTLALTLGALFFASLYFAIGSLVDTIEAYNLAASALLFPMMFLSEAFYPVQGLVHPPWLHIFKLNPLSLMANTLRKALILGETPIDELATLSAIDAAMLTLAATTFKWRYERI